MKVLFLSDFFLSGQTTHVLDLAHQLQNLGVVVHIAFGTIHSRLFWSHYLGYLEERKISFSEGADLGQLLARCRQMRPDIIHSQSSTLFQRAQLLSSRLKIPYVLTCHGLGFNQLRYGHLLKTASCVIATGPNVAWEISGLGAKVVTILNGIDTELFAPPVGPLGPRKNILYVGRLESKRIEPLRHLAKAHERIVKTPLKVISNWNPNIPGTLFRPWQPNLVPILQKAGIVAACGRTAREALSSGNAVLLMQQAYDGVVSPQLVAYDDFDFSGNLNRFPLSNLESDLKKLLRSSYRLRKLQKWGRDYALTHLSSERMAKKTLQVYRDVLEHPQKTSSGWPEPE